jgi:Mg2+ and Co2+ transporter CorA
MMLFGNVNDMLSDKDLKCYVDNVKDQIINYLSYIDNSLGIWVLFVLAKAFERRIAILRDSYGAYDVDNLTDNTKILMNLDRQVLDLQKDAVPFIHELKSCCEHKKCFMHDVFEFRAVHEMRKSDNGFFNSIRKRLLFYADSLNDNEKLLRSTAEANRQIASAKSSNFLAQTNIGLQKRMNWMTFIILILTIVSAISAIFEIKKTFVLKSISEWFVGFIKIIT